MVLRKSTIDKSFRYIPKSEQTRKIEQNTNKTRTKHEQNTTKNKSTPRKQIKKISQKNSLIMWQHKDLVTLNEK